MIIHLIRELAESNRIDGFTITGGEPFLQTEAFHKLLPYLMKYSGDILVYTGYEYHNLKKHYPELMKMIGVVIDGKYHAKQNRGSLLRGSDNQRIYILNEEFKIRYEEYLKKANKEIQNFTAGNGIISVGIHQPDYQDKLAESVKEKGLEENK